jgi:hypothetical protein
LIEINNLEDPSVDVTIILNKSSESGMGAWTGLIWLGIGIGGGLL